ncbi:choice-of-anchor L domain-containing protein, partial [Flavobacterium collinsii]|uniref:choice-of-anchor L domain-containing protein n=1 Tax=Flavobacterium collinsii TaxID=1114861 RepID=UPI0037573707
MKTKTTLQEVGNFIKSGKYIFPFHKNIQHDVFSKISLKSFLILILGFVMYSSAIVAQEIIPVRIGNTIPSNKTTSKTAKTAATTEAVSALAAVAGSIDVANPSAGYNGYNADQLVRNVLTSGCLTISNVRYGYYRKNNNNTWTWVDHTWSSTAGDRQLGYYSKGTSTFPIDEGILLSTGKISSAMGPNTYTNKSDEMVNEASDQDLTAISGRTMHDASILEFNFIPDGNLVEFKFIFASEEYLEYVNTAFNDAFGFFLSGPGISGTYTNNAINLAQLPNGDAVTINNIHSAGTNVNNVSFPAVNDTYYLNNPPASTTMEYDGSTVVLTATYAVTPGNNYKIKMAIADASDQKWDAGVFLKAKSFATNTLVITNPAPVCVNGTANLTLPAVTAGSTAGLTYSYWQDAAATIPYTTPTVAPVGTYYIKGSNTQSGCSDTKPVVVSQTNIVITETAASHADVKCKGTTTGSATVTATGGTAPYTYSWAPSGGSAATASNLAAGTYTVTATDSKGCTGTKQIIITEPAAILTATTSQTNVLCNAGTTGSATATPAGGTGPYTYSWAPSGGSAATASNLAAGTYTVTIKDANLCTITKTVTITEPTALTATTTQTNVLCKSATTGSATVTPTGGTGAYTYSWAPSGGSAATASNLAAGTYTVTIKDANLCTITKTITITEPANALTATTTQTNVLCTSATTGSATVTPAGGTGAYTYSWAPSGGSAATASNLAAGTYTVTIKDANLCTITKTVTITEPANALTATTTQTNVLCTSATTGSATVTPAGGTGAYTYSWAPSGGSAATASNLAAGTYTVTIKDANLCTITKTVTITEPANALTATTTQTNVLCTSATTGSATVTPAGGTGAYTYSWAPSGGSAATASNLAAGTYTVTIKDANLCTITKTVTITEPANALTATTTQTNVACNAGTTGSATVTAAGGTGAYTYSWAPSGGSAATASNLAAGTYTVTIKDANLCTITKTVTITEPTALTATTTQTNVACNAGTTGSATVTPAGGTGAYTYSWAPSGGSAATASNLAAGTYTVTIKDANLCTITKTVTITEPTALTATTTQTNVACNAGATGSATVTAAGGTGAYTYSWAPSGGSAATASNLAAGTYTVTIKDANLCTITKTVTITEPTVLTATTSQTNVGCGGDNTGSATITVSGGTPGYTYLWSPSGGTAATANALVAGTYTVTATDANSCTITKTVTIIDGDSIKPIIDPLPQSSTINCPATPVFATATATDNNGVISSLTYKDVITPGGCAGSYTQTRTWTAVDACGNISLPVSQVIVVQDISAPTWSTQTSSLNKTIECSDAAGLASAQALFPTATDACDTNVSNIVKVSGAFVASQGCANAGTYTNTWTVKDDCGNTSDTFTQVITIQDTSKPTWSTQTTSLDKTIECSDTTALTSAQALFPTATDACDTNVSNIVKVSGAFVASQGCANSGTYTNTWTVKDDCGNTSDTFTQVITIQDTSKPTWSTQTAS